MFRRYGSWLLLFCALALVCLPSMAQPAARIRPDAVPPVEGMGDLHYIIRGDSVLLDLNAATAAELVELPKVGEVLAQRIIDYRQTRGAFTEIEELMEIEGVGRGIFSAVAPYIAVGD